MARYIVVQHSSIALFGAFDCVENTSEAIEAAAIGSLDDCVRVENGPLALDESVYKSDGASGLLVYCLPQDFRDFDLSEISADDVSSTGIFADYTEYALVGALVRDDGEKEEDGEVYEADGFHAVVTVDEVEIEDNSDDDHNDAVRAVVRIKVDGHGSTVELFEWIDRDNEICATDTAYRDGGERESWIGTLSKSLDIVDRDDEYAIYDGLREVAENLVQTRLNDVDRQMPSDIGDPDDEDHIDLARTVGGHLGYAEQAAATLGVELANCHIEPGIRFDSTYWCAGAWCLKDGRLLVVSSKSTYMSARIVKALEDQYPAMLTDKSEMAALCDEARIRTQFDLLPDMVRRSREMRVADTEAKDDQQAA